LNHIYNTPINGTWLNDATHQISDPILTLFSVRAAVYARRMPTIHLTDIALKALKPATAQVDYYCDQQSNFGVRVSPSGTKSFFVRVGDSRRRIHLGKYPGTKLADARKAASRQVNDPQVPIASQRFETALETYFETYIRPNYRERTAKETERLLNKHATPLHKQLREITTSDCTAIFDGLMSTPSEANHLFGVLKTFFAWCEQRQLISLSPIARLSKPAKETSRDRVLTNAELKAVWNATASASQFDTIVRLCILLGQRRGEIATIEPSWITDGVLTIPRHVTKNGVEHPVPLTTRALAILKQTQLGSYNSWSQPKARLDERSGVTDWTLHDLRRTFATIHASIGTPPHITDRLLNHLSGSRTLSPIAKIYNRYSYLKEMRTALEKYEHHLFKIVLKK
jgi:integrase